MLVNAIILSYSPPPRVPLPDRFSTGGFFLLRGFFLRNVAKCSLIEAYLIIKVFYFFLLWESDKKEIVK